MQPSLTKAVEYFLMHKSAFTVPSSHEHGASLHKSSGVGTSASATVGCVPASSPGEGH